MGTCMTKNANIPSKHGASAPEIQPRAIAEDKTATVKVEEPVHRQHGPGEEKAHKHHHKHHHKEDQQSAAPVMQDDPILLQQQISPVKEEVHHSDVKLDIPIITQPAIVEEEVLNQEVHITHQSEVVHEVQQPNIQIVEEEINEK